MGLMREHGDGRCPMYGQRMPDTMAEGPYCGRGPRVSDEDIRADVEEALTEDSRLDASDVQVAAENGIVTLRGRVQSREDRRRAEELATMGRACAMCATNSKSKIWLRVEQLTPAWRATAAPVPARYYLA